MIKLLFTRFLFTAALFTSFTANAHKNSDSYLQINATSNPVAMQWSIAIRDIAFALPLDNNQDKKITWGELQRQEASVFEWALDNFSLARGDKDCSFTRKNLQVEQLSDGQYAVLNFSAECAESGDFNIKYQLLFELDPNHRGLVNLQLPDSTHQSVLSPSQPNLTLSKHSTGMLSTAWTFFREGVWHIWIGFDHLLFLFTLLIPSVLVYRQSQWHGAEKASDAVKSIATIVTAFTVAHSLTLAAAALGWVSLPSRWVEAAIAASIVFAALNNIWPVLQRKLWILAFGLGLIHGFGFAGVLGDLGLESSSLLVPLFTFNLGVEAGQLAIVFVLMPVAWLIRHSVGYKRGIVIGGSLLAAAIGTYWCVTRLLQS